MYTQRVFSRAPYAHKRRKAQALQPRQAWQQRLAGVLCSATGGPHSEELTMHDGCMHGSSGIRCCTKTLQDMAHKCHIY